jgi:hypothetical protein
MTNQTSIPIIPFFKPNQVHLCGGYDSDPDSPEDDPPNSTNDSGFENWRGVSDSEERDDGEEADWYEDDERDYSL